MIEKIKNSEKKDKDINIDMWKQYKKALQDIIQSNKDLEFMELSDDLELLSTWKKWYWPKLNWLVDEWSITIEEIEEIEDLKFLWLNEKDIVSNIKAYKMLLNIVKWDIISILEMEWLINVSDHNINKIKWYLKQIIDLDRIVDKNKRIIVEEFYGQIFN